MHGAQSDLHDSTESPEAGNSPEIVTPRCPQLHELGRNGSPVLWYAHTKVLEEALNQKGNSIGQNISVISPELSHSLLTLLRKVGELRSCDLTIENSGARDALWLVNLNINPRVILWNGSNRELHFYTPEKPASSLNSTGDSWAAKLSASVSRLGIPFSTVILGVQDHPFSTLVELPGESVPQFHLYDSARDAAYVSTALLDALEEGNPDHEKILDCIIRRIARSRMCYRILENASASHEHCVPLIVEELRDLNIAASEIDWLEARALSPKVEEKLASLAAHDKALLDSYVTPRLESLEKSVDEKNKLINDGDFRYNDRVLLGSLILDYGELVHFYERTGRNEDAKRAYNKRIASIDASQQADYEGFLVHTAQLQKIQAFLWGADYGRFLGALRALLESPFMSQAEPYVGFPVAPGLPDRRRLLSNLKDFKWGSFCQKQYTTILRRREWDLPIEKRANVSRIITSVEKLFSDFEGRSIAHSYFRKCFESRGNFLIGDRETKVHASLEDPGRLSFKLLRPSTGYEIQLKLFLGIPEGFVSLSDTGNAADDVDFGHRDALKKIASTFATNCPLSLMDLTVGSPARNTLFDEDDVVTH